MPRRLSKASAIASSKTVVSDVSLRPIWQPLPPLAALSARSPPEITGVSVGVGDPAAAATATAPSLHSNSPTL
jgi:hypothetical protein